MARFSLDEIRDFWTEQAREHGASYAASWSDVGVIRLEIREILDRLSDGERVLDVGCANGFTTLQLVARKKIHVRGLDYIPGMIEHARRSLDAAKGKLVGTAEFEVGDVMSLAEPTASWDTLVVIRVIINLGTWEGQLQGIRECARVLKPGGKLLLSEATLQGWRKLNAFRAEWGLPAIPMPAFNNYLDEDKVRVAVPELELLEVVNFASSYYVGTRVLKPLLIQALGAKVDVADPNAEINQWMSQLPAAGDYGTQKLFVFQKGR